ncbi:histidinol-phosphate transaminase [Rhodococcus sp. HNM0569]|uniref:histidinol-phosphate transaminase n=1 Tax=Rhodococcus sp. HNM0569 TaxID=2716340 RepID=UPI00146B6E9B|nr:histidinol-phosphate transaminase [Rhodococcus sp. HNM0569]
MTPRTRPDLETIPAYVPGRDFPGAIKLASNETTLGPLPSVLDAITDAAAGANRYPDNGSRVLPAALADFLGVDVATIAVGCGSVSLCQELVQATCDAGDEVVFAWRSFEAYPVVTQVAGAVAVKVPLTADYAHDLDAMAAAITDRTRVVFVCNPNNPTGRSLTRAEIDDFLAKVPEHVVVALDEAYFEYNRSDVDGIEIFRNRPNVVVLRTFSKAYGLAGVRVGYAVADPAIATTLGKVHIPFAVSTLAQAAALASLAATDELLARTDAVIAERDRVRDALLTAGYTVPQTAANFVYLPLGDRSADYAAAAEAEGLLLRPYGTDGVRVTVGDAHENDRFVAFACTDAALTLAGVPA